MDYYLAILKRNGIFPFATTWMDLGGIILSEIRQKEINTMLSLILTYIKKNKYNKIGTDWDIKNKTGVRLPQGRQLVVMGGLDEGDSEVQILLLHDCDCILGQRLWCRAQESQSIILTFAWYVVYKIWKPLFVHLKLIWHWKSVIRQ